MFDSKKMRRVKRIHFVGIGGAGMCGIAEVLLGEGYQISGSDLQKSPVTERLQALGATIFVGQAAENVIGSDVVVTSTAVSSHNPEVLAAKEARIPIVPRAAMLSELMRFRFGIAIAGTHGKTTTTSLTASMMSEGKLDPTFVIGGQLLSAGTNAHLGQSPYLVAEADESDASFLHLQPMISIITNIDADHMDTYHGDFEQLKATFIKFIHNLPFYGLAVVCYDCPVIRSILSEISRPFITYGFSPDADVVITDFRQTGMLAEFKVNWRNTNKQLPVKLNLAGRHNALNATASLIVANELEVSSSACQQALANFRGIGRRMQRYDNLQIDDKRVMLIDDYGHHPQEIAATIAALRAAWPNKRLVMIFQPHRFTRTRDLFDDFVTVLSEVEVLLMLEVYSAGESPITGVDSRSLCRSIRMRGKVEPIFVNNKQALIDLLPTLVNNEDLLLTQGAGNIGQICMDLVKEYQLSGLIEVN